MFERPTPSSKLADTSVASAGVAIHSDFPMALGHWQWNLQPKTVVREQYPFKLRFHFGSDERHLLADCPISGKIGRARETQSGFEFVGFLYPATPEQAESAIKWCSRFRLVERCERGELTLGIWTPGKVVAVLIDRRSAIDARGASNPHIQPI